MANCWSPHTRTAEQHSARINKWVCQDPWTCPRPGWKGLGVTCGPCPVWCQLQPQASSTRELSQPALPQALAPAQPTPQHWQQLHTGLHLQFKMFTFVLYSIFCDLVLLLSVPKAPVQPPTLRVPGLPRPSGQSPQVAAFSRGKTGIPFLTVTAPADSEPVGDRQRSSPSAPLPSRGWAVPTQAAAFPSGPEAQLFSPLLLRSSVPGVTKAQIKKQRKQAKLSKSHPMSIALHFEYFYYFLTRIL